MSGKDFINYRNSLSYTPPTPEEAFNRPYTILSYGMYGYYFQDLNLYTLDTVNQAKSALISLLKALQKKEEEKEEKFFQWYRIQIAQNDINFLNTFDKLYTGNEYSKLMTAIEQRRRSLYDTDKDIEANIKTNSKEWAENQNRAFRDAFSKAIKQDNGRLSIINPKNKDLLNRTFEDILNEAEQIFLEKAQDTASEIFQQNLQDVWIEWKKIFLKNLSNSEFGSFNEKNTLRQYKNAMGRANKLITGKATKTGKNKYKTVNQFANSIFYNLLMNGLSSELYLDIGNGTVRVGDVKKEYKTITGNKTSVGNIQTDAISIFSEDIQVQANFKEEIQKIMQSEQQNIHQQIQKALKIYDEDNFIIHYSAKDLYYRSTERRVTIRQEANLDSRMYELQKLSSIIGKGSITDLLFAIANIGAGAILEKKTKDVKDAIVALCATWMFEDYEDTFTQIATGVTNNHLHIYFINGNYYTVSEILNLTIAQLEKQDANKLILVSLKPSTKDPYEDVNHSKQIKGIPRWEYVRSENLNEGKLGIRMNTKILEDMLLNL